MNKMILIHYVGNRFLPPSSITQVERHGKSFLRTLSSTEVEQSRAKVAHFALELLRSVAVCSSCRPAQINFAIEEAQEKQQL